jgi:hypothetical protein
MALDRARDALGSEDDAELTAALRELADAAHGLARALEHQDG